LQGFATLRAEWESYHLFQQRVAKLLLPDGSTVDGVVQGVTDDGAVRLLTSSGERIFNAGEISLRGI
jgi:BirA family biotin operon repressor/biotin-[acetyl-CoA-carboxylase] ligase